MTYNQQHLIGRALDSILEQVVDFPYEIVVGDDASDDGTRQVLLQYQKEYPEIIRLLLYDTRLPGTPGRRNNMLNPMACRGKYTAILDGDDYWIDPNKLQRQYAMMQRHPKLSCCFHDTFCEEVDIEGHLIEPGYLRSNAPGERRATGFYPHEEFCKDRNIRLHTSSCFFRTRIFGGWPPGYEEVVSADHYLFLLITQRGPVFYEDRVSSVNERQAKSLTNSRYYNSDIRLIQQINDTDRYRRQFPATRITPSYSAFAFRIAKRVAISSAKKGRIIRILRMVLRIVREPRGAYAALDHRLRKMLGAWK